MITLVQAQAQLDAWLAASLSVASNQSYRMADGRELRRADAAEIRNQIVFWQGQVQSLTTAAAGGRRRIRYVVPE
jgi:hypothetical protein